MDYDNFDVENIDTSDYLWMQILQNREQCEKILSDNDKNVIIMKKLRDKVDSGIATDDEKKIYWKNFE